MSAFHTPLVVFAFNRPDKVRRLLEVLALVRPSTLLLVLDGPRPDHPSDADRCSQVRRLLERIDWPCNVLRDYSELNQGCDRRITVGIDWAFEQVEEAILLEDDLLPDPSFFPWCEALLDRYRGNDAVHCVSGRNNLGRWGEAGDDHHLSARGSHWGCGTWRRAWKVARAVSLPGSDQTIPRLLAAGKIDEWVARHLEMLHALAARGVLHQWDTRWALQRGLLGGLSVVPPVNLVAHAGFDSEATHESNADSLNGLQPVGRAPELTGRIKDAPDHRLDRWSTLIEMLDSWRDPRMVRLLAKSRALPIDDFVQYHARYHLGPFTALADSLGALHHLRAQGVASARIDALIAVLQDFSPQANATRFAS